QDETVCNIMDVTPESADDDDPTLPPGETRTMRVGMPLYQDESQCDDSNRPPMLDNVLLTAGVDGSLTLDDGSGMQTLYGDGWGYYEFNAGSSGAREVISLALYNGGRDGQLSWLTSAGAGEPECAVT